MQWYFTGSTPSLHWLQCHFIDSGLLLHLYFIGISELDDVALISPWFYHVFVLNFIDFGEKISFLMKDAGILCQDAVTPVG